MKQGAELEERGFLRNREPIMLSEVLALDLRFFASLRPG
jgi:hypothetical protein